MKHVCALTLLLLCSSSVGISERFDVVAPPGTVYVLAGEDMLLPCVLEPSLSAEGMTVEWVTKEGGVVHVYKNKADSLDEQIESYRGRTGLFKEELRAGNVSLKLSSVRLSDANTYRCLVKTDTGPGEASLEVKVDAVGSQPNITIESHLYESATLVCQSEGWYPKPSIEWLTSAGEVLPSGPVESNRTRDGFTVSRRVAVQKNGLKCRVSSPNQTKEADAPPPVTRDPNTADPGLILSADPTSVTYSSERQQLLDGGSRMKKDVQDYKEWIKLNFKKVQEYNSLNDMLLDEQYVDLLIAETSVEQHEREKSRPKFDSLQSKVKRQKDFTMISVRDLFRPIEDGSVPKAVVLLGESGYGKSVTSKKILYDWASGRLYSDLFDLALLLKCDVLNQETSGASGKSLVELASSDQRFRPMVEKMLNSSPERVLLIIDGFEKLNLSEETSGPSGQSENGLHDLLRRHQHSSLLITTRSRSLGSLDQLIATRPKRFTEEGVKKYFQKFFKDEQNPEDAFGFVHGNEMLSTSCCIPVIYWIICTVLKISEDTGDVDTIKTTTSIFVHVVSTLLENHTRDFQEQLQSLCRLAEMGTKNSKVLFERGEISNVGLNPDRNPFLHKLHQREEKNYSFIHLSFQEFFTALKYTMVNSTEAAQRKVKELREFVEGENPKPHHLSVICFLFGLSNHEVSGREKLALEGPGATVSTHQEALLSAQSLKDWLSEKVKEHHKSETLFLLHCLYELHEEEFLKRTMEGVRDINLQNSSLKRRDCWVLQYCLRYCCSIARLNLRRCKLTADGLRLLKPVLSQLNCQDLRFDVEGLGDGDFSKFLEGAQEVLTKSRPDRISQLGQRDECDGRGVPEKPQRKSVAMHVACMESVRVRTVSGILDIFRASRDDLDLEMSAEVDEQKCSNETTDFSNFTVKRDKDSFMLTVEQYENSSPAPAPAVSLITLTLLPSEGLHVKWEEFLKIFNSMNVSSTGKREQHEITLMEEKEDLLMSFLRSMPPGLRKVELQVSCLNEVWGKRILTLIQDHPEPLDISVCTSGGRDSLCSSLSLTKADGNYRLGVRYAAPEEGPGLSEITVVLPNPAADTELTPFLNKLILSKRLTEETQLDQHVPDLLSLLPNLRELTLKVSRLTEVWGKQILTLFQDHHEPLHIRVWIAEENLFLTKADGNYRVTYKAPLQKKYGGPVERHVLSEIIVALPNLADTELTPFLKKLILSKRLTEETQLDQYVHDLLDLLPNLTELTLRVSRLTEVLGKRILTLFQDNPEPLHIRVWTTEGRDSDGNSLRSTLSLTKVDGNYRLGVRYAVPEEGPGLSEITVGLLNLADTKLTALLKKLFFSKRLTEETQLDEDVPDLLSLLPNLRELKLDVGRLTRSWACRIFSIVRAHCSEEKFSIYVEAESTSHVDNLCSGLFMEKHKSILRVTVEEKTVCLSDVPNSTPLSHLSVMAHSENLNVENWVSFLGTFHNLSQPTDSGDRVDGHLKALLSSLRLLGDLQQVKLRINCFSKMWATWTLSLKDACPSLEKIMLSAGLNALACNSSGWMERGRLNPRGIQILKNAQKDCHIELRGIKPSTNRGVDLARPVNITIFGKDYKENYF